MLCIAIQLAKLSGFNPIITTSSLSNAAYCTSAGATHVIDYHTVPYTSNHGPSLGSHITSNITTKPIRVIYDVVSTEDSQRACWDILSDDSGKMSITLELAKSIREEMADNGVDSKVGRKGIYAAYGNANAEGMHGDGNRLAVALEGWLQEGKIKVCSGSSFPAPVPFLELLRAFSRDTNCPMILLLAAGCWPYDKQPNAVELLPGGLAAIGENVKRFGRAGGVSAVKMVVRPFETDMS